GEVRIYNHLFTKENPLENMEGAELKDFINPESLEILSDCQLEPSLKEAQPGSRFQFLRQGYFCVDAADSSGDNLIFNRTLPLRDTWAKIQKARKT
ncbi:MAG: glutamine--tRNA ligase, partial [Candidatus Aminicenantes bacterium]|nr:glutamine--tRNA ligase [Candidatus Aminicenantes bacterium]